MNSFFFTTQAYAWIFVVVYYASTFFPSSPKISFTPLAKWSTNNMGTIVITPYASNGILTREQDFIDSPFSSFQLLYENKPWFIASAVDGAGRYGLIFGIKRTNV